MRRLTEAEEAYFAEMRSLTTDPQGRRVLVGLSFEESAEYIKLLGDRGLAIEDGQRFIDLDNRYQRARHQVLAAENELRTDKPTRN